MRGTTTTRPGPVKTRAAGCTTPRARTNTHHKHWTKKMGPDSGYNDPEGDTPTCRIGVLVGSTWPLQIPHPRLDGRALGHVGDHNRPCTSSRINSIRRC